MADESRKPPPKRPRKRPAKGGGRASSPAKAERGSKTVDKESGTSPWEWAAAGIGAAILATIVGYLVYEAIARPPGGQPDIVVSGEPAIPLPSGTFLVPIVVENRGHATGAGVTVSGALLDASGAVTEESAVTFDFVATHSAETGGLYFTADPGSRRLVLRVEGYADP
jgi:uncharacterized protein (TIGR02588 family)